MGCTCGAVTGATVRFSIMAIAPQIPFELFEPEPPTLDNFLMGDNAEAVARVRALATHTHDEAKVDAPAITLWGGHAVGKTHLLRAASSKSSRAMFLSTLDAVWPGDPFMDCGLLAVDDVDRATEAQQAWLFTAFNHVVAQGGAVVTSGATPPITWQVRDDLRTRLGSGIVFELRAIPQDALLPLLYDYALQRGIEISEEVLTYVLSHTKRDVATLCHSINGIDRLSLALKRPITIPLVRAFLAEEMAANVQK
jgi:DnaA-homolog protein